MVKCTMLNFHKDALGSFFVTTWCKREKLLSFLRLHKIQPVKKINWLDENGLAISISSAFSLTNTM